MSSVKWIVALEQSYSFVLITTTLEDKYYKHSTETSFQRIFLITLHAFCSGPLKQETRYKSSNRQSCSGKYQSTLLNCFLS